MSIFSERTEGTGLRRGESDKAAHGEEGAGGGRFTDGGRGCIIGVKRGSPRGPEGGEKMDELEVEALRKKLLEEVLAGAFAGLPAMLLDERRIRNATAEELKQIAREYGY